MKWTCENCGETLEKEEIEELLENTQTFYEADLEDVKEILLVDCDGCDDSTATYKRNDISSEADSEEAEAQSKGRPDDTDETSDKNNTSSSKPENTEESSSKVAFSVS